MSREKWGIRSETHCAPRVVGDESSRWSIGTPSTWYALKDPVCLTNAARCTPVNLFARVEQGLMDVLGGDIGYGGRITKNPTHPAHTPIGGGQKPSTGLGTSQRPLEILEHSQSLTEVLRRF